MPQSICANIATKFICRCTKAICAAFLLSLMAGGPSAAQDAAASPTETAVSLAALLREAEQNNPQIQAAWQAWQAARKVPSQVSTLPDPQFQVQQLNVGSPRPFAGYTNSNFAYFGLGFSQDIPYPGKLHLKGEIAQRDASVAQQQYESARRSVLESFKAAYFQLVSLDNTLKILRDDSALLQQVERAAAARYQSGAGNQQDVLEAQLEQTKLLRETASTELSSAQAEARLKEILNRSQASSDITPSGLPESALPYTFEELLDAAIKQNPDISGAEKIVERQKLAVNLAKKDFYPDFNIQYMWQRTDPAEYPAYYMLTFGIRVPIYRRRRQRPELEQSQADLNASRSAYQAETQQVSLELRNEYDAAQKTSQILTIYREGLVPQSRAEFQAGLAGYETGRQDFQATLSAFLDVLRLDQEYWQTSAEHETALAQLEKLTGLALLEEGDGK